MDEPILTQIKTKFNAIKELRIQVMHCFNALESKQHKLKNTTVEFIKNNKHNLFIFGLDSFQFQSKLIEYEYNDMKQYYFALNNRMYCEYYKLYKIILNYTEEVLGSNKTIEMLKLNSIFPVYKDLEPLKQYDFEIITELHKTILILLNDLNDHIHDKEAQLKLFILKQQSGLNINNFVNTYDYNVITIKQKRVLYLSYLDFFHNIHTKHFKRFSKKMKLMNDYLDEDIKFDEGSPQLPPSSPGPGSVDNEENVIIAHEQKQQEQQEQPAKGLKSLLKSNIKKVIGALNFKKTSKPFQPQPITININKTLDMVASACDNILCDNISDNSITSSETSSIQDSVIEETVIIEDSVIEDSVIENYVIEDSVIEDSVIKETVIIENSVIENSVITQHPDEEIKQAPVEDTVQTETTVDDVIDEQPTNNKPKRKYTKRK